MFIAFFLTLYGLLHVYAFTKVQGAFAPGRGASMALGCLMLLMFVCPLIVRSIERYGMYGLSKALSITGFVWMGFLFLFVSVALFVDLCHLSLKVAAFFSGGRFNPWVPSPRAVFFTAFIASIVAMGYGCLEARAIRTEHVTIYTTKIPKAPGRLRIVQISDIHLGWLVGEKRLEDILLKVQEAGPDLLVCTGDLVDGQMDNCSGLARMLRDVRAPYGKFAVTGNHEFYAGLDRSLRFTEAAGFEILRGAGVDVEGMIYVVGVDDEAGRPYGLFAGDGEEALLASAPAGRFVLFLKHKPPANKAPGGFDLQLSGHTHGGQIFPFTLIIHMLYPVDHGFARLEGGGSLFVSRGAGTWGPPFRVLAPPGITVIDLIHGQGPE